MELLEDRTLLSSVQVVTNGAGKIELPDFDENLGTLQQASVGVYVHPVDTGDAVIPDVSHGHTVTISAQSSGSAVGGFSLNIPLEASNIGDHSHSIPTQTITVPFWSTTTSDVIVPIDIVDQSDPDIQGQTHSHGLPDLVFETLGGSYLVQLFDGHIAQFSTGTGSATNGIFVPGRPNGVAHVLNGTLTIRVRAATSPSASAGDFSHTHAVSTSSGPFVSAGVTSSVDPTGDSNHRHSLDVTVDPLTISDPAELATRFAEGSSVDISASVGTSFEHTHSVPTLPTTATTTFTFDAVPVADSGGDYTANEGDTVRFDGSNSTDDVGIALFEWDFDFDGEFSTDATGPVVFETFPEDFPARRVYLRTTDTLGQQSTAWSWLRIENVAPKVEPPQEQSALPGVATDFDLGSFTDLGSNNGPYTVFVNWGDGSFESIFSVDTPGSLGSQSRTYSDPGTYVVDITVSSQTSGFDNLVTTVIHVNDFPAATLSFSETEVEEGQSFVATVQLSRPVTEFSEVVLNISGTASDEDVMAFGEIVAFQPGQQTATVVINTVDDTVYDPDESLVVTLSSLTNTRIGDVGQQSINILDNAAAPEVSFTEITQVTPEGTDAVVTARLSSVSGTDIRIPLSLEGSATLNVDYFSSSGTELIIPAGQLTASTTISVLDDTLGESNELIDVVMQSPVGAVLSTVSGEVTRHTVRIPFSDVPTVGFTAVNQRILEAQETFDVNLRLSGPSDQPVTVMLQKPETDTAADTIEVTFAPGDTVASYSFSIDDNSVTDADANLQFALTSPQNALLGNALHVTTVQDDDVPVASITTSDQDHFEDIGQVSFTVELSQSSPTDVVIPLSLSGTATEGADYTLGSPSVTIPAGQTSVDVVFTINNDADREPTETLYVSLSDSGLTNAELGEVRTHIIVLRDDDPDVGFNSSTRGVGEDDGLVSIRANLSAVTNKDVVVPVFAYMGSALNSLFVPHLQGDFTSPPAFTITIPAGSISGTADVLEVIDDSRDEPAESLVLVMGPGANANLATDSNRLHTQQRVTIYDNDAPLSTVSLTTDSKTISERAGSVSITARLSSVRTTDVRVQLRYSGTAHNGNDYSGPAEIVIPAGSRQASVSMPIINDSTANEGDETIRVSLGGAFGGAKPDNSGNVTFTIRDDDRVASVPRSNAVKPTASTANRSVSSAETPPGTLAFGPELGNGGIDDDIILGEGILTSGFPDPEFRTADETQPFTLNIIVPGGAFSGSTVFFDANFDKVKSPDEPSAISEYDGTVSLTIPQSFDVDGNLILDLSEGQLVVVDGVDTATNLPLELRLTAPAGFFSASMMSTVVTELIHEHGLSLVDAQTRVLDALSLPDVNLFAFDIVNRAAAGDSDAASVFAGLARLENSIIAVSKLVSGIPTAPPMDIIGGQVFADIAESIVEPGSQLDLALPAVVSSLIDGALFASGLNLDPAVVSGAADIIAETNQRISDVPVEATSDYLSEVATVQSLVQGEIADQLRQVGAGTSTIATAVQNYTGGNLTAAISTTTAGNVVPVALLIDDVVQSEGDSGNVSYEFQVFLTNPPVEPVTVDWSTSDDSATVADGDYQAASGQLSWAAGDATPRTISVTVSADTLAESDETVKVVLDNVVNATIRRAVGYGFVLNDDTVTFAASDSGEPNDIGLIVDRDQISLLQNDELLVSGDYFDPQNIVIDGRDDVDDTLHLDFAAGTYRSDTITFDGGGGTGFDTARVSGGTFETVTVGLTNPTDGQTLFAPVDSSETITLNWLGLEPFEFTSQVQHFVFDLPADVTQAVLEDFDPNDDTHPGVMRLYSPTGDFEEQIFVAPTESISINSGNEADTIVIHSVDPAFTGTLTIDGSVPLSAGDLDLSFGEDGRVTTDNPLSVFTRATAYQPDGRLLVGYGNAVLRYNVDGTLDDSFGTDGQVEIEFFGFQQVHSLAVASDGKIAVSDFKTGIVRLNSDGTADTSFSDDGLTFAGFTSPYEFASGLIIQNDGKIVVGGTQNGTASGNEYDFALTRIDTDGTLDMAFGTDGIVTANFFDTNVSAVFQSDRAFHLSSAPGDKIVLGGEYLTTDFVNGSTVTQTSFAVARFTSDGRLDTSFGINGLVTVPNNGTIETMAVGPAGEVFLGAPDFTSNTSRFEIIKLTPAGVLDTSFGVSGIFDLDVFGDDYGVEIVVQPDGKLIAVDELDVDGERLFAAVRFDIDGAIDTTFGAGGLTTVDFVEDDAGGQTPVAVALQNNAISIVGYTNEAIAIARIIVNEAPLAIAGGGYTGIEGGTIILDASATLDLDTANSELIFEWDLDYDGTAFDVDTIGELTNASFADDLTRTIAVRVTDPFGAAAVATTTIRVDNVPPTLVVNTSGIVVSEGALASLPITAFDVPADMVSVSATLGEITSLGSGEWRWDYTGVDDLSTTVEIVAVDEDGGETTASFNLTVNNVAPTLTVNTNAVVIDEGHSAAKTITASDVPDDTVTVTATYGAITDNGDGTWVWNYTGEDDLTTTEVEIVAADEDGGQTVATFDLTVKNVAPEAQIDSISSFRVQQGVINFQASGTDPAGSNDPLTYAWDFGDGQPNQTGETVSYAYDDYGTFTVTLTVDDGDGGVATQTESITVSPRLGPIGRGIAVHDTATGTGYVMFSDENIHTRFAGNGIISTHSHNLVAVQNDDGQWFFSNNAAWVPFTPTEGDRLIASVDYQYDTILGLQNIGGTVEGIDQGYVGGNLSFLTNSWNNVENSGEFQITGSYFHLAPASLPDPGGQYTGQLHDGVAVHENAAGTGYLLFSAESVHTRFAADGVPAVNSDHFIAAQYTGGQWYFSNNSTWVEFTPTIGDRLLADINYSASTIDSLQNQQSVVDGIDAGFFGGDLTFVADQFGGVANENEFEVTGTYFDLPARTLLGDTGYGVAALDNATGVGFLMFSSEDVKDRFPGILSSSSDHLIAVQNRGPGQWFYNNNSQWVALTPASGDRLLAEVDFEANTATSLQGATGRFEGIDYGYAMGDLQFAANQWAGQTNEGEFEVTGTYFETSTDANPVRYAVGDIRLGLAVADTATGGGYVLYSRTPLANRVSLLSSNSDYLAAVRYEGGEWQVNDNQDWVSFLPEAGDRLLATLDFDADLITGLEGATGTVFGIDQGYDSSDLTFLANTFNGVANAGEFTVNGSFFELTALPASGPVPGKAIAETPATVFSLDVNADGELTALGDGLGFMRYLAGFDDTPFTLDDSARDLFLDVDGDGRATALTDGLLITRYLAGFRGDALVDQAVGSGAARTDANDIANWLEQYVGESEAQSTNVTYVAESLRGENSQVFNSESQITALSVATSADQQGTLASDSHDGSSPTIPITLGVEAAAETQFTYHPIGEDGELDNVFTDLLATGL